MTDSTPHNPLTSPGKVSLTDKRSGRTVELDILEPTIGVPTIDVRQLYDAAGFWTFDPGFTATASCASAITYVDGENGILLYRGYPIADLIERASFPEVCYLLLNGELPSRDELDRFTHDLTYHTMVHEQIQYFLRGFRRDAHPMAVMVGMVGALSAFYHDSTDIFDPHHRIISSHRLIAKVPTIAAMAYKYSVGQPIIYPRNDLSYAENFLHMIFATPCERYDVPKIAARAIDAMLIVQADHEQNASTSTVRTAGSSWANPFACVAAGIASLWGPIHGGANQAALEMLQQIGDENKIPEVIRRAKDKSDPFRLMGFGHRVYKSYDPRAKIMRKICYEVLDALDMADDPLLKLAMKLEKIALEDEYFIDKKLYPNVDFYSGIILKAIGFPTSMFTVLFAVARTVGWVSHWNEMIEQPGTKIYRPRQLYIGHNQREFVPVDERT